MIKKPDEIKKKIQIKEKIIQKTKQAKNIRGGGTKVPPLEQV